MHLVVLLGGLGGAVLALETQVLVDVELAEARVAGSEHGEADDNT